MSRFFPPDFLSRRWGAAVLLAAILVLYFALALNRLGKRDLTYDELMSSRVARMPVKELVADRLSAGHPPLYFLMLKGWVGLTGQRPATMELFSILLGVLGIPLMFALGRELKLGHWAWATAALWAVQPAAAFFARDIRPYIGAGVLGAFILWSALRTLRGGGLLTCLPAMAGALVGAAWNLNLIWLWMGLVGGAILTDGVVRKARFGFWLTLGFGLFVQLTALAVCLGFTRGGGPIEWIPPMTLSRLLKLVLRFLGGENLSFDAPGWRWLLPCAMAVAIARESAYWLVRSDSARSDEPGNDEPAAPGWGLTTRATLLPLLLMVLISFALRPVLLERYLLALLPGMVLLTVRQLSRIKLRRLAVVICVALVLLAAANDRSVTRQRGNGLRHCIGKLERNYRPGDVVMTFHPTALEALRLFSTRDYRTFVVERSTDQATGWRTFEEGVRDGRRLWVLAFWHKDGLMSTPRWKQLENHFRKKYVRTKDVRDTKNETRLLLYALPIRWE